MKYDVQGGQEIGNSSQGRSLNKLYQNKVMPERKNLSSGSNDRSRSLNRFGRLLNFGRFRGRVLQRGNRFWLVNLGRMFVNFGRSSDFGLWFRLEEVTDSGGETTGNFRSFGFHL